ncbi:flagellar hook-length control protein FliK [Candidatus Symbiopectobacterium sp. NZEC151]|uniref:flagellar hook-length control protein FliK n=1 Tax=Candidatus Symbiopectobacterium sp. NZEC151 TaxID=2820470 RepID=UPI0022264CDE|nr:flagellar hook-length control protein FliK [Candidatus Symbiopectobacterium sp. NZEC151]MCW2474373.1 flagellar hook-length control protein FliK [Candidatus Symbiopectobacterium sp. NZEC151]
MMLPIVTTTASTGVSDTAGSASGLLTTDELPQDFVQLLSLHLPKKAAVTAVPTDNTSALSGKDSKQKLLDALSAQDIDLSQQDLNTLLKAVNGQDNLDDKTLSELVTSLRKSFAQGKEATLEKSSDELPSTDTQAVQALMAMLAPVVTPATPQSSDMSSLLQAAQSLSIPGLNNTAQQNTQDSATASASASLFSSLAPRDAVTSASDTLATAISNAKNSRSTANDPSRAQAQVDDSTAVQDKSAVVAHTIADVTKQDISGNQLPLTAHTAPVSLAPNAQTSMTNNIAQPGASAQLNAQLGTTQWQDSLGQQIIMLSRNGQQSVQLRLHPEELGTLHISLRLDDNQAQIHLASANSQVRSALEAALPHLRAAMAESGINLGQSNVASDNSGWQQAQQQMAGNNNDTGDNSASYRQQFASSVPYGDDVSEIEMSSTVRARPVSGVDIFA